MNSYVELASKIVSLLAGLASLAGLIYHCRQDKKHRAEHERRLRKLESWD